MNIETSLNYVTLHSQAIIQWLCLAIVLLVGTLIAIALFGRREAAAGLAGTSEDISEQLSKLLEASAKHAAPAGEFSPGGGAADDAKLAELQGEIKTREEEIVKLRDEVAKAAENGAADPAMGARLKELEAKLAEYEILEDDIADLSLYKEENSRLKSELEALKADGGGPAPQPNGNVGTAEAQPQRTAEAAAQAAAAAAAFDEPAPAATPPAPKPAAEGADDLFAEFATALEDGGIPTSEANRRTE